MKDHYQDRIVNEPWRLKKAGYNFKFLEREFTLEDRSGRLDLLYQDLNTDEFVVIELKVVPANEETYNQISNYVDSVSKTIGSDRKC